jgi:hypothetical protein
MVKIVRLCGLVLLASLPFACQPDFADRPSTVQDFRMLAVQAEPAEWVRNVDPDTNEAKPAKYRALLVSGAGTVEQANLEWAFCTRPKPLTELNDVSIACFQNDPSFIVPIGNGPEAAAAVPENTCRQFGPDVPEDQSFRPADPDVTGGYYQPLRVLFRPQPDQLVPTIAKVRIRCGLPGASQEQTARYNRSYHLNTNPRIDAVTALLPGGPQVLGDVGATPRPAPLPLSPGQTITLSVAWPACPVQDVCGDGVCGPTETKETGDGQCDSDCKVEQGCGGAERFLAFSLETRSLDEVREIMRVSWFATSGTFRDDRTGREAGDLATTSENDYTAPTALGTYPLWIVLRDSRGGVTWRSVEVLVR